MKVLHVIPSLSIVHGGPSLALALMERALAQQGISVETATTDDDGPGRRTGKPLDQPVREGNAVRWYFAKRLDFYKVSPAFARWIEREVGRYDLVHIHALFSFLPAVAARAARHAGVPYVVRPLGTLNEYGIKRRRPWLKALSMRLVEGPMLRHAAAVHFTSDEEAMQARALGLRVREAVIPLGIPVPGGARARMPGAAGARLLYLSRLDAKKNLEGLLAALALLKDESPHLQLVVAGDGEARYVASLKEHARSLGVSGQVTWAGHIEGATKAAAFESADIFVLPSHSENFGIAAAEALAAGLPCVLGEGVAIAKDVVQARAGIAVGIDAPSIADGLRRMIGQDDLLAACSANAAQLARERYSLDAMGAALKRLYAGIVQDGPR